VEQPLTADAEVVSNTRLEQLLAEEPPDVREEILRINDDATDRSLQAACSCPSSLA
jgi:hypothetical protein